MKRKKDELQAWEDKFNACLGIELNDPQYFKVHPLLVLTFMLQTNRYADAYLREAVGMLKAMLEGTLVMGPEAIGLLNTKYASITRTVRIFKPAEIRDDIAWTKTILDVRLDSAQHYQNDVTEWSGSVLRVLSRGLMEENRNETHHGTT
jgi:hypothetical protein